MSLIGVKSCAQASQVAATVSLGPGLAGERSLDRGGALRDAGHAAEGDAGLGDITVLHRDVETAADGRNILIEALGQLVALQPVRLARQS